MLMRVNFGTMKCSGTTYRAAVGIRFQSPYPRKKNPGNPRGFLIPTTQCFNHNTLKFSIHIPIPCVSSSDSYLCCFSCSPVLSVCTSMHRSVLSCSVMYEKFNTDRPTGIHPTIHLPIPYGQTCGNAHGNPHAHGSPDDSPLPVAFSLPEVIPLFFLLPFATSFPVTARSKTRCRVLCPLNAVISQRAHLQHVYANAENRHVAT